MARNREVSGSEIQNKTADEIQRMQSDEMAFNESAVRNATARTGSENNANKNANDVRHKGLPPFWALYRSGGDLGRGDSYDNS